MPVDGRQYIGGEFISAEEPQDRFDRWTGELIGTVHWGSREDAERAIAIAEQSLGERMTPSQRADVFDRVAESLSTHREFFARLITSEIGKPVQAARVEVSRALDTLRFCSEETRRLSGEVVPIDAVASGDDTQAFTIFEPRGIVAAITPFNFPLNLLLHKIGPALGAGNSVLLKPSEKAPLVAVKVVELFDAAGLPPGRLNLVMGDPREIVRAWQADARVSVVSFTGSARVGWELKRQAPHKHHILELGSNTAMVVTESADVQRAAEAAVNSAFANSGQACVSLQRVYVDGSVAIQFQQAVIDQAREIRVGNPHDDETLVGPLVTDAEVERLGEWIEEATRNHATVAAGGHRDGSVLQPTVLLNAAETSEVISSEAFGPLMTINTVEGLDDAIVRVNSSKYGLNVGLFTSSLADVLTFAREVEAGSVLVNLAPSFRAENMPYGGVKESGHGREGVGYSMRELSHEKLVILHP